MATIPLGSLVNDGVNLMSKQGELTKLKKACDGFEASFLRQMLQVMRQSIDEQHVGDATGSDQYKQMFDDAIAERMAQRGALGVSKMMFETTAPRVLRGDQKPLDMPVKNPKGEGTQ